MEAWAGSRAPSSTLRRAVAALRSSPARIYLETRAAIWVAALLAYALIAPHTNPVAARWDTPIQHDLGWATDIWAHWDGGWFLRIAEHSYASDAGTAAYYPLYPGAVAILGRLLDGHFIVAGILLSLAAGLIAAVTLDSLAALLVGTSGRRSVIYLSVFPMSLFLQAVYSEAFYLALAVGMFALAERGRLGWASLAAGFATLARPFGVCLVAALAVYAWRSRRRRSALLSAAVVPVVFAAFPLTLWLQIGDPWAFAGTETIWGRHLSRAGPLGGLWQGLHAGWDGVATLAGGPGRAFPGFDAQQVAAVNVEAAAFLLLFLWLTVETWRRLPTPYGVFVTASLAMALSVPSADGFPLLSLPRIGLVLFPFFVVLSQMAYARSRLDATVLTLSALLLGITVTQWALWQWVA
jgi:hypothetical protein